MKSKKNIPNKEADMDHVEKMKAFIERKKAENEVLEKLLKEIKKKTIRQNQQLIIL